MENRINLKNLDDHIDEEITLAGFVDGRRDHGKLVFLDLRDETGKVQMVALPKNETAHEKAQELRPEWVIEVSGKVNERPEKMVNADEANGHLEVAITDIAVLSEADTPPFEVDTDGLEIGEDKRLEHRYIDLRRERLQKNIKNRHRVLLMIRNFLDERGFSEIETPILSKSTPEGARDYIVPARLYPGNFYALPQSPQQYKQLLMVSGFEKYFQIARCMRDEDTRGDRQAEFTQIDLEKAYPTQDEILGLVEEFYTKVVEEIYPKKRIQKKPWPRLDYSEVMEKYGTDRPDLRENMDDPDELAFAWVVNFPLFEAEEENGHLAPSHHMFTRPKEEDVEKLDTDPHAVRSYQHDLVLNGYEIGGGSLRIHESDLQEKIFDLIGFEAEDKAHFAHMLEAFKYGVPPHGGIAMGLERFLMILEREESIREVMAFPKTGEGRDLTLGAPSGVSDAQLEEANVEVTRLRQQNNDQDQNT